MIGEYKNYSHANRNIENKLDKKPKIVLKKANRFSPGICKLCGETFRMITNAHAQKHGFRDANEMANSDKVLFCTY